MDNSPILWLLITQIVMLFSMTWAKVPAIIVFGDSSVDAGNNNQIPTVARSNFLPYGRDFPGGKPTGRFSNGRVPTDFISQAFGLKPTIPAYLDPTFNISDFATGVTFASAATGYDPETSNVLSVISLDQQLNNYKDYQKKLRTLLGYNQARERISESLHVISMGTNDFLENYYTLQRRSSQYTVGQYEDFLVGIAKNFTKVLYSLGAWKISLGGIPPMGCLPLERTTNLLYGSNCREQYNSVAFEFNKKLNSLVNQLNKELPRVKVVFSNPYDILMQIVKKPYSYGFDAASVACCATGFFEMGYACDRNNPFTCKDANKYVFWDSFHPTEKTNHIVANYVVKNVLSTFL